MESYNLIIDYINNIADSKTEKQLCAFIISNLIPELETLSFSEIDKMLDIVTKGMKDYSDSPKELSDKFLNGLKHKLKNRNLNEMMKSVKKVSVPKKNDQSIEGRIKVIKEYSGILKEQKKLLSVYN